MITSCHWHGSLRIDAWLRQGLNDIGQLKEAYRDKIQELKKKATVPGATDASQPSASSRGTISSSNQHQHLQQQSPWPKPPPPPSPQEQPSEARPLPGVKTLSSFLDIPKAMDLPQRELEALWRLRHAHSKQSLCATMPADTFSTIASNAKRHPQFIVPGLPRKVSSRETGAASESSAQQDNNTQEGAPIHFLQWTFPTPTTATVLFTHLAEYKLRGEHAQPHTTITHHLEMAEPKGLVLCQGTVVPDRGVGVEEGKWLVMQLQKFYNIGEAAEKRESGSQVGVHLKKRRRRLVEMFSKGDQSFRVEDLLEEAERLG